MRLSRRTLLLAAGALPIAAADDALLTWPMAAEPSVLIPGLSGAPATRLLGAKLYRGLLRFDATGPQPDLATAWEVSEDGLTYAFHLRPGVTWHDGGGFSAEDVVFSLDRFHRLLQPRLGLQRISRVQVADPRTVTLTLGAPFPPLLRLLDASRAPIVPQHVHDVPGFALDPRVTAPVGAGPFRLAGWLRLERFDWFAGPKPALRAIACPVIPDPAARIAVLDGRPALLAADAAPWAALPQLRQSAGLVVEGAVPPTAAPLAGVRFNLAKPPLDDPRVRLALAAAVDRAAVLRQAWMGLGQPATGPTVSASIDRNPAATLPDYDPRAASAGLTAAGVRPGDDGVRLRLGHLAPPDPPWQAMAGLLRAAWDLVGVELAPEPVTRAEWTRRVAAGEYETAAFVTEQTGDPLLDLAGYAAELPQIAPFLTPDGDIAKAQQMLVDAALRLWLVEPATPVVRDRRLHLPGGVFGSFATASVA